MGTAGLARQNQTSGRIENDSLDLGTLRGLLISLQDEIDSEGFQDRLGCLPEEFCLVARARIPQETMQVGVNIGTSEG
jgi:hypothetical protein